jgi:translation initiation factor 1A
MPRNTRGGKKQKKQKNDINNRRLLLLKDEEQYYSKVIKRLGGPILETLLQEKNGEVKNVLCVIRGKMRKRVWIEVGDWILVSKRETSNNDKYDVIHVYHYEEVKELSKMKEINTNINCNNDNTNNNNDVEIFFDDI